MDIRAAIAHELDKLEEGDLELVLKLLRALAAPDFRTKLAALIGQAQVLGQSSDDMIAQRALEALEKAQAIAKLHGITEDDVIEEIRAYRAESR